MKLPKSFTKVTPFSKTLAMILFILFPILGFFLGVQYERYAGQTIPGQEVPSVAPQPIMTVVPTQISVPSGTPISPIPPRWGPSCPPGYVQYGMPLGCITIEHMQYCRTHACPICLSSDTNILTAKGERNVKDITVGTLVWTVTTAGEKTLAPVIKIGNTAVPAGHQMIHLVLTDGRNLYVSPGHPSSIEKPIADLRIGESYNGSVIASMQYVTYSGTKTYDILPQGTTGQYFANDILVGSTLR